MKDLCQSTTNEKLHEELGNAQMSKDKIDVNNIKEYIMT